MGIKTQFEVGWKCLYAIYASKCYLECNLQERETALNGNSIVHKAGYCR